MKFKQLIMVSSLFALSAFTVLSAQPDNKADRPSPPADVSATVGDATVNINYSSPAVKKREIWGGLVPYGEVWRTGANEATVFETSADLKVGGETLPAGKYGLFTIPGESEWTFIFNSVSDQWGHYQYNAAKDVLRIMGTPQKSEEFNERMTFKIADDQVLILWESLVVGFPIATGT